MSLLAYLTHKPVHRCRLRCCRIDRRFFSKLVSSSRGLRLGWAWAIGTNHMVLYIKRSTSNARAGASPLALIYVGDTSQPEQAWKTRCWHALPICDNFAYSVPRLMLKPSTWVAREIFLQHCQISGFLISPSIVFFYLMTCRVDR